MTTKYKYDPHSFAEATRVHISLARQTTTDAALASRAWLKKYLDKDGFQIPESGGDDRSASPAQSVGKVGDKVAPQAAVVVDASTPAPELTTDEAW
jgi:hypothetical protein